MVIHLCVILPSCETCVRQLEMKQEILMLLTKIRYALGDHQGALDQLEEVALDSLPLKDISSRKMKLIGECFAIKGLSMFTETRLWL